MKKAMIFLAAAVLLLTGVAAYAQSLGDLAREEQRRREEITDDKLIVGNGASTLATDDEDEGEDKDKDKDAKGGDGAEDPDGDGEEPADPDEPTDLNGRTESYWRKTLSEARAKVAELEEQGKELQSQRNEQQRRFSRVDGVRRNGVQKEIQKNIYERDVNKEELQKALQELESLQNEGQASGALPGWLE
ncbi:MAG: hypothetical protein LBT74_05735 [Acidobacteriota bacterium]|jgi:hypothetical protein|nr:hypothetical protein [Acidobacteriota bacterium]